MSGKREAAIPHSTKIATCCYCGTRAALVLSGKTRHELTCSGCGAPLHDLKMLRADKAGARETVSPRQPRPKPAAATRPARPAKPAKRKKGKRRKGVMSKVLEEAFDLIEDIFD